MGQPVRIFELAERMIRLAGFEPGEDIEIVVTGTRAGERLHEILFAREEPRAEIGIDGVMAAKPVFADRERVERLARRPRPGASPPGDRGAAERVFEEAIPEFRRADDRRSAPAEPSPSRVDRRGCHPRRVSASGLATSVAGEPLERLLAPGKTRRQRRA